METWINEYLTPSMTIIFAEISAILLLLVLFVSLKLLRRRKNEKAALVQLESKIENSEEDRAKMLETFLKNACGYDSDSAVQKAVMLVNTEKMFYRTIMRIYQERNVNALQSLDESTENLISAYRNVVSGASTAINEDLEKERKEKSLKLMATVSALEDRNRELIEEISKLRNEMDVTVNEYTSAFKNRQDSGQEGTTEESGTPDSGGEAEIPDSSGEAMSGPGAPSAANDMMIDGDEKTA